MNEYSRKPVDELEFTDDFMFSTIMQNPEICKGVLERLLKMKIAKVEYPDLQKSISPYYSARGVRLDVYCESDGKVYDVEMQNSHYENLPKRARYYQSMLDSEQLNKGWDYKNLKESFIIFICKNDPFSFDVPVYFVEKKFRDVRDSDGNQVEYRNGVQEFFFNSEAYEKETDPYLRSFLKFVHTSKSEDDFTRRLNVQVKETKERESFRSKYMEWMLHYTDAKYEGKLEGRLEGREENKLETAKKMIQKKLPKELVLEITEISEETYTKLLESITQFN